MTVSIGGGNMNSILCSTSKTFIVAVQDNVASVLFVRKAGIIARWDVRLLFNVKTNLRSILPD